jgi:hypothetical protein
MLVKDHATGQTRICSRPTHIRYIDTGKVKIGCAYIPDPMPMSVEAVRIQAALLGHRPPAVLSIAGMAYCAMVGAVLVTLFTVVLK